MKKKVFALCLLVVLVAPILFLIQTNSILPNTKAQSGTTISNIIIKSDTTWTKTNSPYSLTGPVGVNQGVTLTIEPGVTVNLNSQFIEVNGTLRAIGSKTDPIHFNNGQSIDFSKSSSNWTENTKTGCILENAIISATYITTGYASPKINNNTIIGANGFYSLMIQGSPTISNNTIISGSENNNAIEVSVGTPLISNNNILGNIEVYESSSPTIFNNTITGRISLDLSQNLVPPNETSVVAGNIIHGEIYVYGGSPTINGNIINGAEDSAIYLEGIFPDLMDAHISNNIISDCPIGVLIYHGSALIEGNLINKVDKGISCEELTQASIIGNKFANSNMAIYGFADFLVVEGNLIINNTEGVYVTSQASIQNNTIVNNKIGIDSPSSQSTIIYNNIEDNSQNSIFLSTSDNVIATSNWWGTTDTTAIDQTIHDSKNDFKLGTISFEPFLTAPNPQAPDTNAPIPTLNSSPSPTSTPVTPEFSSWTTLLTLSFMIAIAGLLVSFKKRKGSPNP